VRVGKESEKLEFKKSTAELKEAVISISAILNKHGGGELYFGVQNNGMPIGQMLGESTLRDISQAIANHIEPQIYPIISEVFIADKPCIHVEFSGDDIPYFAYGRVYVRVADEDKQMTPAELKDYIQHINVDKNPWDSDASENAPDDISETALKDYLERANQAERINFSYTSQKDMLTRLNLLKDGKLKNAAVVFFLGAPLLEVQMATFASAERLTFNDIKRDAGNISQMVETAERYIRNTIRWRVVLDGSIKRKEIPEIPMEAVREAIINSFCHRDYQSSQNNVVAIFSNRVEIYNPGLFPKGLTPRDFISGEEYSVKRNPLLAQLMYYVKDIESFGTGLKKIAEACDAAEVKVEFQTRKAGFAVVFYRPDTPDFYDASDVENDVENDASDLENDVENAFSDVVNAASDVVNTASDVVNSGVSEIQMTILQIMQNKPKVTAKQLSETVGINTRNVQAHIQALRAKGLVERVGPAKGGHWAVKTGGNL
jgi:ATP-dependent DNA helicase RecG